MVSSDVAFFSAFTAEVEEVVSLTGNSGKRVRRVLERYMPRGMIDVELAVPQGLSHFAFAVYIDRALDACKMANDAIVDSRDCGTLPASFAVVQISFKSRSYRLQIKPANEQVPETMRGRQAMLEELSFGMSRLRVMLDPSLKLCFDMDSQTLEDHMFDVIYSDCQEDNTPANRKIGLDQFEALVGGDYSSINDAPIILASLANVLNPTVDIEMSKACAADRALIDAAFEDLDRCLDSDRTMPLSILFPSFEAQGQHAES